VILVVGLNSTIYLESGKLSTGGLRLWNEEEGANVTFTMLDNKLAFRLGAVANAFVVVRNGIVTFNDCLFNSGSENVLNPNHVSVYIALVRNTGVLVMHGCIVSNIQVEGDVLIHGYEDSRVQIEVCYMCR
jgi:hypothetical protein